MKSKKGSKYVLFTALLQRKDINYLLFALAAALTITAKASAFNDAPPTKAPSMSGWVNSSAAFLSLTEPPYWIITCWATFASNLAIWSRINLWTACACAGVADLPVPIAQIGS